MYGHYPIHIPTSIFAVYLTLEMVPDTTGTLSALSLCLHLQKCIQLDIYPIITFVAAEQHNCCSNGKRSSREQLEGKMAMSSFVDKESSVIGELNQLTC